MTKTIKASLVALSLLAGTSVGLAADNGNRDGKNNGMGMENGINDTNRTDMLDREMIDPNSTGSIQACESQLYDEFGNCVVDPGADMR